ncbi:MAG TPA: serine protease [Polyangiaceae bacterium]
MHRKALVVVAALAGACHGIGETPGPTDDSTLAVLGPGSIACGAVAISEDLAVTANHCLPETVVDYLVAPDGRKKTREGRGFVVVRDPSSDLALFATTHLVPAELRKDPPDLDGVASMVAHVPKPWGVVAIHPTKVDDGFVRTERLRVGVSGSGLWDSDWRLVGVAIGNDNRSGYFASVALIHELVRQVPRDTRGRIQTASEPKVCGEEERDLMSHPEHPDAVNVQRLLDKATVKNHRIDSGLADVSAKMPRE